MLIVVTGGRLDWEDVLGMFLGCLLACGMLAVAGWARDLYLKVSAKHPDAAMTVVVILLAAVGIALGIALGVAYWRATRPKPGMICGSFQA